MPGPAVSNTGPLIALNQIGRLALLEQVFNLLLVPPAVVREAASVSLPIWIQEQTLQHPIPEAVRRAGLGAGETEAISLALERQARIVLLDERPGRRLAQSLGLRVTGTLGVVLAAKRQGLIAAVRPVLNELAATNFFATAALYESVLKDAGEA